MVYDLLLDSEQLPNLKRLMVAVVAHNEQKPDVEWTAPILNVFLSPDGALKFEALVVTPAVRHGVTALCEHHAGEMHDLTDRLMGVQDDEAD